METNKNPKYEKKIVPISGMKFMKNAAIYRFTLPNKDEGIWESINAPDVPTVMTAGFTEKNKLILISLFRLPVESWVIELPGGDPEVGEDLPTAARREFIEETGYDSEYPFVELCRGWAYNGKTNSSFVVFHAKNCKKVETPKQDVVEKYLGLKTIEVEVLDLIKDISEGNMEYDPPISHSLVSLIGKRIIL